MPNKTSHRRSTGHRWRRKVQWTVRTFTPTASTKPPAEHICHKSFCAAAFKILQARDKRTLTFASSDRSPYAFISEETQSDSSSTPRTQKGTITFFETDTKRKLNWTQMRNQIFDIRLWPNKAFLTSSSAMVRMTLHRPFASQQITSISPWTYRSRLIDTGKYCRYGHYPNQINEDVLLRAWMASI